MEWQEDNFKVYTYPVYDKDTTRVIQKMLIKKNGKTIELEEEEIEEIMRNIKEKK